MAQLEGDIGPHLVERRNIPPYDADKVEKKNSDTENENIPSNVAPQGMAL